MSAATFAQPVTTLPSAPLATLPSAENAASVTPSDTEPLAQPATALWVGGGGAVALVTQAGQSVTIASAPAGSLLPIACTQVKATGTTATSIVALW
ncbi:MAG TPA: hypothetical protein VMG10_32820 [Gemmataceae bacterium]|nr:hypothetical protein [Gemmataceae bacterium]